MKDFALKALRVLVGSPWNRAGVILIAAAVGALTGTLQYVIAGLFTAAGHAVNIPDTPVWLGILLLLFGLALLVGNRLYDPKPAEIIEHINAKHDDLKNYMAALMKEREEVGDSPTAARRIESESEITAAYRQLQKQPNIQQTEPAPPQAKSAPLPEVKPTVRKVGNVAKRCMAMMGDAKENLERHDIAGALYTLLSGIRDLPHFTGDVYRGIKSASLDAFLADYDVGKIMTWDRFTSATRKPEHAFYGDVLFIIESKTGRALSGDEEEVLFMPGTSFKVLGLERRGDNAVISMEEIAA